MENEIVALKTEILLWQDVLNKEGIWLFLGTLGSWSVEHGWLRTVAFITTLLLFFWRAAGQRKDQKSFVKRLDELEMDIKKKPDLEIADKAHLYDISELRKLLGLKHALRYGVVYFVCMAFWGISIFKG